GLRTDRQANPQRQVAYHDRLARQLAYLWQAPLRQRLGIEFEHHRSVLKVGLLCPTRMQFADPAYRLPVEFDAGTAARMQGGMRSSVEAQLRRARAKQCLHVHFDVVEI